MNLFNVILQSTGAPHTSEDAEIQRALVGAWKELRLIAEINGDQLLMWSEDEAMVNAFLALLPLINIKSLNVKLLEQCPTSANHQPPHPGIMPLRRYRGLSLDEVFLHYDNDDMGLEERFGFIWELCLRAQNAGIAIAPRMCQAVLAMARALNAYYDCDPARDAERRALQQRAVWLTEVGVDPEAALLAIRNSQNRVK